MVSFFIHNKLPTLPHKMSLSYLIRLIAVIVLAIFALSLVSCSCSKTEQPVPEKQPAAPVSDKPEDKTPTWPLTGMPVVEGADAKLRPLSVKIENTPVARPQLGLSHADVVYESVTEGGITRFNCLFQSDIPAEIGPVRSARNSDISIVPQYQGLFFYSGANSTVNKEIAAAQINSMGHTPAGQLYHRVNYREAPHNLYIYTADAYSVATSLGFQTKTESPSTLAFGANEGSPNTAATNVVVPLSDNYVVNWAYDESLNAYARSMDGATFLDAEANQAIVAQNIVVLWTSYTPGVIANGSQTYNVDLTTSGSASIFTGGQRFDGTWEATKTSPPRFKDLQGKEILLTPGKTWFEIVDLSVAVSAS